METIFDNLVIDSSENTCHICKGRPTRSHRRIWDGCDFIEIGAKRLKTFAIYELQCMAFSLAMKDYWNDSDHEGMKLIEAIIDEKEARA